MKKLAQLWSWWIELLGRRETGECLAAMRVLAGVTVLIIVAIPFAYDYIELFYYPAAQGGYLQFGAKSWLVEAAGGPSPRLAWSLLVTAGISGLALVLGVQARVAALQSPAKATNPTTMVATPSNSDLLQPKTKSHLRWSC